MTRSDRSSIHLRGIERIVVDAEATVSFPLTVPAIRELRHLDLATPVTFFVGANGSGKSTLLEAIAAAANLPTVGTDEIARDDSLSAQRLLGRALRLTWSQRTHRGFFLRAEDFFGFTRRIAQLREELRKRLDEIGGEYDGRSEYARSLAELPLVSSMRELEERYGLDPDAQSHGESFLSLFDSRFVPGGLYLLDEPEAALSPQSQLALLSLLGRMIGESAQFVIATHSPILLAFPDARIYSFDCAPIAEVEYSHLEHVTLTREFLSNPERYLRHLL